MSVKKELPLGIEDFERIRNDGFYYVDKTGLIKGLLENPAYVNLFTRPRRFDIHEKAWLLRVPLMPAKII